MTPETTESTVITLDLGGNGWSVKINGRVSDSNIIVVKLKYSYIPEN